MDNTEGLGQMRLIRTMWGYVTIDWERAEDFSLYLRVLSDMDRLIGRMDGDVMQGGT